MSRSEEFSLTLESDGDVVQARVDVPERCDVLYVLGHGAGAGMRHAFMDAISDRLVARGIGTVRYQFPYMQAGKRRPDPPNRLEACVRAAVGRGMEFAHELGPKDVPLPLIAGGKSMGGRMTSNAQARSQLPGVRGIAFLGFPLHPAKKPSTVRADHLKDVEVPMLFLQGTRDALAELDLLEPVCDGLNGRATLRRIEGADHGFHVLKRSGRTEDEVLNEVADCLRDWVDRRILQ